MEEEPFKAPPNLECGLVPYSHLKQANGGEEVFLPFAGKAQDHKMV